MYYHGTVKAFVFFSFFAKKQHRTGSSLHKTSVRVAKHAIQLQNILWIKKTLWIKKILWNCSTRTLYLFQWLQCWNFAIATHKRHHPHDVWQSKVERNNKRHLLIFLSLKIASGRAFFNTLPRCLKMIWLKLKVKLVFINWVNLMYKYSILLVCTKINITYFTISSLQNVYF